MPYLSHCATLTRTHDRNRYICALFAPFEVREAWFALFAFQHEIASIADKVGEEMVGFIRYAWWRETLDAVFKNAPPRGHPVAEALAEAVKTHALPRAPFDAIIDAHEKALVEKQELDEVFLEATAAPLMRLCGCVVASYQLIHVIPAQAGISLSTTTPVAMEITAFAGMTISSLTALGVAWGAMEAARLPNMDAQHRKHFLNIVRERLVLANKVDAVLRPFIHTVEFYVRRLEKGNASASYGWLTLVLCVRTCL